MAGGGVQSPRSVCRWIVSRHFCKIQKNAVTCCSWRCLCHWRDDPAAFEAVVRKYQDLVCAITFSGTTDRNRSEELAQETFLSAWKNLPLLRDFQRFRPWLCSIIMLLHHIVAFQTL